MRGFRILYFVWEGLGAGLRALSLSGSAGNVLALFLYILVSLLPVLMLGWWRRKHGFCGRDLLLVLLSAYTFYLLYAFVNPGILSSRVPAGLGSERALPYLKAVCGGLWLSILASWFLLTWTGKLNEEEILDRKRFLYQGMGLLLTAAMALVGIGFLYSAGTKLYGRLVEIRGLAEAVSWMPGEQAAGNVAAWDMAFAFLQTAVRLLPTCFLMGIFYRMKGLLKAMEMEPFGEMEVHAAKKLADVSQGAVTVSVLCDLLWNGALFFCSAKLTSVDYQWELSLFPLLAAFGALILARYLREAGEIHRDNEMII